MHFKDSKGREWDVTLNLAAAQRIDKSDFSLITERKFSILRPDKELFQTILMDPSLMTAIVWAIVRTQVADHIKAGTWPADCDPKSQDDLAQVEFAEGFNGQTLQDCRNALWEALGDFFRDHQTVLSVLRNVHQKNIKLASDQITQMEPELDSLMAAKVKEGLTTLRKKLQTETLEQLSGEPS